MNTEVNYEIAKLLKDKGFKGSTHANWWILQKDHHENYKKRLPVDESKVFFTKNSYDLDLKIQIDEEREHNVFHVLSAPAIAEVVMWLYEKHGIWIAVNRVVIGSDEWGYGYIISYLPKEYEFEKRRSKHLVEIQSFKEGVGSYHGAWYTPTEAYEAAITYCLENLIQGGNK